MEAGKETSQMKVHVPMVKCGKPQGYNYLWQQTTCRLPRATHRLGSWFSSHAPEAIPNKQDLESKSMKTIANYFLFKCFGLASPNNFQTLPLGMFVPPAWHTSWILEENRNRAPQSDPFFTWPKGSKKCHFFPDEIPPFFQTWLRLMIFSPSQLHKTSFWNGAPNKKHPSKHRREKPLVGLADPKTRRRTVVQPSGHKGDSFLAIFVQRSQHKLNQSRCSQNSPFFLGRFKDIFLVLNV